ncbi:MAG: DegT/DnrJ/EryC1/StrS family aminotransferase [Pseudomonadota bacterium]
MRAKRNIPFFNYSALFERQKKEIMACLEDVLSRGAFILQKDLEEFEDRLKSYLGVKYAFGVADGTNALILALRAAGIGPGDEVILSSHTYIATAASVHFAGATPVLTECGPDHMLDPDDIEYRITSKTKAIMPTQLNGRTCNMDVIEKIADQNGLLIIEDAAQALGSQYKGKHAGTFGKAGTFSLYPAKLLGCFGDGGVVVTNDDDMGRKLFLLRDHGRDENGEVVTWGTNSRLDNMQAAVLNLKMKTFDQELARRREIAGMYHDDLKDINDLTLPPEPVSDGDHFDVYQNYELEAGQRDSLREFLTDRGVRTIIQWAGKAVHQFKNLGFDDVRLPVTDAFFKRCFMLPMHTALSNDDVEYICQTIQEFYAQ